MFLDRVRQAFPELTESQKRLASYLVSDYRDAAFMTASRLADIVNLNEATVVRFAQRLGYTGYPALIDDIRAILQKDLGESQRNPQQPETPLERMASRVERIAHLLVHVSPDDLEQAAAWITQAQMIYVIGHGGGAGLAYALAQELTQVGRPSLALSAGMVSLEQILPHLGQGALLIIVSTGSEMTDLHSLTWRARNAGARTLSIAQHPLLTSAQAAHICLSLPPFQTNAPAELCTVAVLVDTLIMAYRELALQDAQST